VTVAERIPTAVHVSEANASYLVTKARNGHHTLDSIHLSGAGDATRAEVG
jgi:GTP cyclohydrolase II